LLPSELVADVAAAAAVADAAAVAIAVVAVVIVIDVAVDVAVAIAVVVVYVASDLVRIVVARSAFQGADSHTCHTSGPHPS
jgi:hypothetical protein